MRRFTNSRGTLVALIFLATVGIAACSANHAPTAAGSGIGHSTKVAPTAAAAPPAGAPSAAPGSASASSAPPASAWLSASEIPFGTTYNWSLFTGNGISEPIGAPAGNGVYYVSPDTVFQAITSCGSPSLILSTPLGARQREFKPTSGDQLDLAGQWISSYPDATAAQAAWQRLQAAYTGCLAQLGNPQITLTETARAQYGMAWFLSTNGAVVDLAPYIHEYFVLHANEIAYVYVEGGDSALTTTPNDSQVVAIIAQHLDA